MISICPITVYVNFDCSLNVMSAKLLHSKVAIFCFRAINIKQSACNLQNCHVLGNKAIKDKERLGFLNVRIK